MAPTSTRGFASLTLKQRKRIASMGGKAAHAKGTGHQYTSTEAAMAGRLGGLAVSKDKAYMAQIGAKGGRAKRIKAEREGIA